MYIVPLIFLFPVEVISRAPNRTGLTACRNSFRSWVLWARALCGAPGSKRNARGVARAPHKPETLYFSPNVPADPWP